MLRLLLRSLVHLLATLCLCGAVAVQATELRIGLAADVTSLDPHHINLGSNTSVLWHLYDALTNVDADARLVPGLALSWQAVAPTTWESSCGLA